MKKYLVISVLGALIFTSFSDAHAQLIDEYDNVEIYKYQPSARGFSSRDMEVRIKLSLRKLLGEPVIDGTFKYITLYGRTIPYDTEVWIPLKTRYEDIAGWIKLSPAIGDEDEWGYNTPESPNWSELIYSDLKGDDFFSASEAKDAWYRDSDYSINEDSIVLIPRSCELTDYDSRCR